MTHGSVSLHVNQLKYCQKLMQDLPQQVWDWKNFDLVEKGNFTKISEFLNMYCILIKWYFYKFGFFKV